MNGTNVWRLSVVAAVVVMGAMAAPVMVSAQDAAGGQNQGQARRGGGRGGFAALSPTRTVEQLHAQVNALTLKDDQKTRLDAIFKEAGEQAKSLETEVQSLQGRERAQKLQPFARDLREKVNGVLDEQQRQTLRKNMAARQTQQMVDRWKQALGQLNLTTDQQTKVDAVLADTQKKMEAQAAERAANPDQGRGQGRGGRGGAVMQETRAKIEEILTADQKAKLAEVMPQGGRGRRGQGGGNQQ